MSYRKKRINFFMLLLLLLLVVEDFKLPFRRQSLGTKVMTNMASITSNVTRHE
jgi:hypothetical protein